MSIHLSHLKDRKAGARYFRSQSIFDKLNKAMREITESISIETESQIPSILGLQGNHCFPSMNSSIPGSPETKALLWVLAGARKGPSPSSESALPSSCFAMSPGSSGPRGIQKQEPRAHASITFPARAKGAIIGTKGTGAYDFAGRPHSPYLYH